MPSEPGTKSAQTAGNKMHLLLVDDDPLITESLGLVLSDEYDVVSVDTRKQAIKSLNTSGVVPSIALVDLGLPPKPHSPEEGFRLIHDLLGINRDIKILILSGQSEQQNIQHALTLGAVDFIPKPCDTALLKARLAHQVMMLEAEKNQQQIETGAERLLGKSLAIETLRQQIQQFADTPYPVLIEGESGSGKELVAESLHAQSSQQQGPFMTLNCAAFTMELLESQLFGHSKGAFTGATAGKAGFFEDASNGTLFLDEIGELPTDLQSKLLRVLENGEYYRIGETRPRKSTARIIAASNRDLKDAVRQGTFRPDLYHRLSVLTIHVPPLSERGDDCLLIMDHFRQVYSSGRPFELDPATRERLLEYSFPGNIRELRNIVIRLSAKYAGRKVGVRELEGELEDAVGPLSLEQQTLQPADIRKELQGGHFSLDACLGDMEKRYINEALEMSNGNLSKAARLLGINRTTLYSRLERFTHEDNK